MTASARAKMARPIITNRWRLTDLGAAELLLEEAVIVLESRIDDGIARQPLKLTKAALESTRRAIADWEA